MGYDIRDVLVTSIVIDGVPTPRKRLCIERNRHRSRAQYALDEEDVVACVIPCRWRREGGSRLSPRRVDGVVAPSTPSMACCSLDGGTHPDAVNAKAPRRRWQLTGVVGRVEASQNNVPF